jgi:hypothetical protein
MALNLNQKKPDERTNVDKECDSRGKWSRHCAARPAVRLRTFLRVVINVKKMHFPHANCLEQ